MTVFFLLIKLLSPLENRSRGTSSSGWCKGSHGTSGLVSVIRENAWGVGGKKVKKKRLDVLTERYGQMKIGKRSFLVKIEN